MTGTPSTSRSGTRWRCSARTGVSIAERLLRRHPATIALLALTVAAAIAGRGLRGPTLRLRLLFGTGYEQLFDAHRWWTPLSSLFLTDGGAELPLVLAALLTLVAAAERLMGIARLLLAFVTTSLFGVIAGTVVQATGDALGELWSRRVSELVTLDPMTAVAGVIMTASAFAGPLWRRRIRVVVSAVVVMFLLYSGEPSDLYRALATVGGLGLGAVLSPRVLVVRWQRSSHHESRMLLSAVVAIAAIGPAITVFSRLRLGALAPLGLLLSDAQPSGHAIAECHALALTHACLRDMTLERISGVGPVLQSVLPLLTLLVAAIGLARGRRFAAWLAVVVNVALGALAAFYYGFLPLAGERYAAPVPGAMHYWEASAAIAASVLLPLGIAVLVLANLGHVTVRSSRRARRRYPVAVAAVAAALSALYLVVGSAFPGSFRPAPSFWMLLADLPDRFVPIGFLHAERLLFVPSAPPVRAVYLWMGPLFWLVVVIGALVVILGSAAVADPVARARVAALLRAGAGSLSYWATWDGNSYWLSGDGRAAVAYRVLGGVAVTTSEPIGDQEAALAAIPAFARFCDDNGWTPVFYAVHEPFRAATAALGWRSMGVGDETVISPAGWSTTGKHWQDVRSSLNRAERAGIRAEWTSFEHLAPAHARQLAEISEAWVAEKDLPEMGFTLGGIDELRDPEVRMMVAIDADEHMVGATSWLPTWRHGRLSGWTLDFMRRVPDGPNGIMEFLIARAAERFREDGIDFMSLSAAPLAGAGSDGTAAGRVLAYLGARLEPVYGFRSLLAFKRKFLPEFRPLYLAYPDPLALPAIGLALARAYVSSLSVRQGIRFLRGLGG